MEKEYTNTRRKNDIRNDWKPNTEQPEDGPYIHTRQVHNKEKEEALDLIAAYPDEMLHLMEQVDRGEMTEEEVSTEMDRQTRKTNKAMPDPKGLQLCSNGRQSD